MTHALARACSTPMCGGITVSGPWCPTCAPVQQRRKEAEVEASRPNATERGYDHRWRKYRTSFLARHPLCNNPFHHHAPTDVVPAIQVDHIIPHKGDTRLFWDKKNHQALCRACGAYKSSVEEGGRAHTVRAPLPPPSGIHGVG